jgi:anaerobic selenocysteine-containing dehydrogenase
MERAQIVVIAPEYCRRRPGPITDATRPQTDAALWLGIAKLMIEEMV